jgi:molybdate transport system regulatory protein
MIEVGCQIFIRKDGYNFLDPLKSKLLLEIGKNGSLSCAAKNLKISYQHAWNLINEINQAAPEPLVLKQRGGANGGGAEISGYGKRILSEYSAIEKQINKLINQINNEINF